MQHVKYNNQLYHNQLNLMGTLKLKKKTSDVVVTSSNKPKDFEFNRITEEERNTIRIDSYAYLI